MKAPSEFILVVDDNPVNLGVVAKALKNDGHSVRVAIDGASALHQVNEELPALILLDVMMSGIDGFSTCRLLKKNPFTKHVPVIFMTALADSKNKTFGLSLGAIDYVTKPFNEPELLARVNTHLQQQTLVRTLHERNQQLEQEVAQRRATEAALQRLNDELLTAQVALVQKEQLAAMRELARGVADEINNFAKDLEGLDVPVSLEPESRSVSLAHIQDQSLKSRSDSLISMRQSLQFLAHGPRQMKDACLHEILDSALRLLRYRWQGQIKVERSYGQLPVIRGLPDHILQALVNILGSSMDALNGWSKISEVGNLPESPWLRVSTSSDGAWCILDISHNAETKESPCTEQDTRLDLLVARHIVVATHGGEFSLDMVSGYARAHVKFPRKPFA